MDPYAAAQVTVAGFGAVAGSVWIVWKLVSWVGSSQITTFLMERDDPVQERDA